MLQVPRTLLGTYAYLEVPNIEYQKLKRTLYFLRIRRNDVEDVFAARDNKQDFKQVPGSPQSRTRSSAPQAPGVGEAEG